MTSASVTILNNTTTVIFDHHLTTYNVRYWIVRSWLDIDYNVMADFLTYLVIIQRDWLAGISLVVIHLGGISLVYITYFLSVDLFFDLWYVLCLVYRYLLILYLLLLLTYYVTCDLFFTCDLLLDHRSSFDLWPTFSPVTYFLTWGPFCTWDSLIDPGPTF